MLNWKPHWNGERSAHQKNIASPWERLKNGLLKLIRSDRNSGIIFMEQDLIILVLMSDIIVGH